MSKKIYDLAKELEMGPLDLVESLKLHGLNVKNHMQELTEEEMTYYLTKMANIKSSKINQTEPNSSLDPNEPPHQLALLHHIFTRAWEEDLGILKHKLVDEITDNEGLTPLHYLAKSTKLEVIEKIIEHHSISNVMDYNGYTPLHYIAQTNNFKIINLLLKYENNVNFETNKVETPLHIIAQSGNLQIKILALKFKNIDSIINFINETPMNFLANTEERELIVKLLSHSAIIKECNFNEDTPLHILARRNKNNFNAKLILSHPAIGKLENKNNETPLHLLSETLDYENAKEILQHPSVDQVFDQFKQTPLHVLIKHNKHIHKEVLSHPSIDKVFDHNGNTPLHYSTNLPIENLDTIPENWFKLKNNEGSTPLHFFMREMSKLRENEDDELICKHKNIFKLNQIGLIKNNYGNTPLHELAEFAESIWIASEILKLPKLLTQTNQNGATPIHLLCKPKLSFYKEDGIDIPFNSRPHLTKFMQDYLFSKPEFNQAKDKFGKTPQDYISK